MNEVGLFMDIEGLLRKFVPSFVLRRFEGRPNLQKIIANTGWLFFDKILRMGVGMFVGVWVARYLGPEKYGVLSYAQAFVALFAAIATLGLDGIAIRDIVREPEKKDEILGSAFILKLLGGILTSGLAVSVLLLFRPDDVKAIWMVGIISFGTIFQAFDAIDFWFKSQIQSKYTVIAKGITFILTSIIKVVLILKSAPLVAFAWVASLEIAFGAVGLLTAYKFIGYSLRKWYPNIQRCKQLLVQSWPLLLALLAYNLYSRIDQVMIRQMLGEYSSGIYSASTRIYEINLAIAMMFSSSFFPDLVSLYEINRQRFLERYEKLTCILTLFGYISFISILIFGKWLINLLYGVSYSEVYDILMIQIFGSIFLFNAGLRSSYLNITSNQTIITITTISSAVLNVILNYFFIPVYGMRGAAFATVLTQVTSLFLSNIVFSSTRRLFVIQLKGLFLLKLHKRSLLRG